jgi:hypothetical protein
MLLLDVAVLTPAAVGELGELTTELADDELDERPRR